MIKIRFIYFEILYDLFACTNLVLYKKKEN